jgi:hypothetical protein
MRSRKANGAEASRSTTSILIGIAQISEDRDQYEKQHVKKIFGDQIEMDV